MADEEQNETTEETPEEPTAPEAEASAEETPPEPDPEAPPEEPGPPVPEPESPEPIPEPAPEPVAEGDEAPVAEATEEEGASAEEDSTPAEAPTEVRRKRKRVARAERRQRPKPKREQPAERKPITRLPKPEHERGRSQERRGVVVSAGMDKTIVVRVDVIKSHPRYKKVVRRSQKFHAHDEQNQAKAGDVVRIVETRPLSKTKNWRLAEIVEVAQ
jgi:small subunit ribosomal protein S17